MVEIVNRQRKTPIDGGRWRAFTARALKVVPANGAGVTVAFVSDRAMRELNRRFRGKDYATNVLSFPAPEGGDGYLGDVALALGVAVREALTNKKRLADHALHLTVPGVLHLLGELVELGLVFCRREVVRHRVGGVRRDRALRFERVAKIAKRFAAVAILRIELAPHVVLSLSVVDDRVTVSPADVRAIRAAGVVTIASKIRRTMASSSSAVGSQTT